MKKTEVRIWMYRHGVTVSQVASDLEVWPSIVSRWLDGKKTSSRVEQYFLNKGCPAEVIAGIRKAA